MNLLYLQPHAEWGSAEEYFQTLIEGVKSSHPDWEVSFLCLSETKDRWRQLLATDIDVIESGKTLLGLSKQIKDFAPNLIHLNHADLRALAASRWARVPEILITDHSAPVDIQYNWRGALLWQLTKRMQNLHLIAVTQSNKNLLVEKHGFSEDQVEVIPHGLKLGRFEQTHEPAWLRAKLNIPEDAFVLICVARLSKEKAHEVLFDALQNVVKSTPKPIYLLLAGDGARRPWLEAYAGRLGLNSSVRFLGHRSDILHLLQAADVFVLSSDFEGMPFALLEAMAAGKSIIATQVGGVAELVTEDTGILVPPRDPQTFAKAILWALEHPQECRRKGEEARKRFLQEYTSEKMIERTLALYERSVANMTVTSK